MRANFSAEYFAFFTIFAQNPVACAELPHSCLPLDSSAFQPITPRFPSMQKRSPPHSVQLIDRPVKYSEEPDGSRWVEVHEPLSRNRSEYESDRKVPLPVTPALRTFISGNDVDLSRGSQALERRSGMPVNISLVQKHY